MTDFSYIERYTGAVGDAAQLVIVPRARIESDPEVAEYFPDLTDSDLTDFADAVATEGTGMSLSYMRNVLTEVRDGIRPPRPALDQIIDLLPEGTDL